MKTAQQLTPVSFYKGITPLTRIENEQPGAIKSIAVNMGLGRKSENSKITEQYSLIMVGVTIVSEHGKIWEMISLPLYKYPSSAVSNHPDEGEACAARKWSSRCAARIARPNFSSVLLFTARTRDNQKSQNSTITKSLAELGKLEILRVLEVNHNPKKLTLPMKFSHSKILKHIKQSTYLVKEYPPEMKETSNL
ncbi:hypothetical protein PspCFBP13506_05340 [Pseudomonas sp. CFBP13506]|uniref:hypothetical protein n=1 Tax=Pseudomonas sp. CFBP13506 TaxID=2184010 RepID=UPI0010C10DA8|nr:hypothetical protein [Pseudomonas sp. CFBP13506]TKJ63954.1 hypothetical protein PspCFBP13506_05340 [Pseudomonas sp. CFBP13506]